MALYDPSSFMYGSPSLGGAGAGGGYDTSGLGMYAPAATAPAGAAGSAAGATTGATTANLGLNVPTAQLALGGLSALGGIFNAFSTQKLAKKQFEYQKGISDTNLANSIQSYNTTLADRARARGATEGQSADQIAAYTAANSLPQRRV